MHYLARNVYPTLTLLFLHRLMNRATSEMKRDHREVQGAIKDIIDMSP